MRFGVSDCEYDCVRRPLLKVQVELLNESLLELDVLRYQRTGVGRGIARLAVVRKPIDRRTWNKNTDRVDIVRGERVSVSVGRILMNSGRLTQVGGVVKDRVPSSQNSVVGWPQRTQREPEAWLNVALVHRYVGVRVSGDCP